MEETGKSGVNSALEAMAAHQRKGSSLGAFADLLWSNRGVAARAGLAVGGALIFWHGATKARSTEDIASAAALSSTLLSVSLFGLRVAPISRVVAFSSLAAAEGALHSALYKSESTPARVSGYIAAGASAAFVGTTAAIAGKIGMRLVEEHAERSAAALTVKNATSWLATVSAGRFNIPSILGMAAAIPTFVGVYRLAGRQHMADEQRNRRRGRAQTHPRIRAERPLATAGLIADHGMVGDRDVPEMNYVDTRSYEFDRINFERRYS